jgi:hypothetical protein
MTKEGRRRPTAGRVLHDFRQRDPSLWLARIAEGLAAVLAVGLIDEYL